MSTPATLLVVEDDQSMLEGIKDLLQLVDFGYDVEVLTAGNGRIGLDVIASAPSIPDLIISDIMMPEMEGFEFLERVRQNPAWIHIPVIFLTAKGSKQDIFKGKISGADLYITKPFNSTDFLELVKSQLDRAFQLQETRQQIMNNLKKDILQILNHEFRTPLTYVTAYYEMLADSMNRVHDSENFYEYLRGIQVGCVRLTRLVEDFIQVMDIRMGELESKFAANAKLLDNLDELLQLAIAANQDMITEHNIQVHYTAPDDPFVVYGYAQGLREVFARLLNNALKFTSRRKKQDGQVSITVKQVNDSVSISFQDEGIGFPMHMRDQIFQLFFQYNRGLFEQQGSGVGLTIAKAWIDLHDGLIEVESEEQKGSTFTVILPLYTPGQHAVKLVNDQNRLSATILVVEDDIHLLIGLQELLQIYSGKYQFQVLTAENGRKGLEVLAQHQPDLIVSDIMMPEMGGYEFLNQVRQNPSWVQIPFIFLTAKGERRDIHRGWRSGVEEYITKPYDSDELLELISSQLDRHFRVQTIVAQNFESLKRSILNLITPDFRLPLSDVAQYSQKLVAGLDEVQTDAQLKESLQGIQVGSVQLTRLVEDLISLAELKTGEAETAFSLRALPISNIGPFLYDAAQYHLRRAEMCGISIRYDLSQQLPYVYSDTSLLLTGLQRLIEKGIDYCEMQAGAELVLSTAHVDGEVCLTMAFAATLPVDDKSAFLAKEDGDWGNEPPLMPSIDLVRGIVGLHNGRILIDEQDNQTRLTIALPVHEPVFAEWPG
ncbi:MAG: response regulator [Anaerolineales bacterium]|nr:response regulator [Anaerolineales bacterium]